MERASAIIMAMVLAASFIPACLESNPQPSPGGGGGEWNVGGDVADRAAPDGAGGAAAAGAVDALADVAVPSDTSNGDAPMSDGAADLHGSAPDTSGCGPEPENCGLCESPYPACVCLDGQWVCVQCTENSHCGGNECVCDTSIFSCLGNCGSPDCVEDEDCAFEDAPEPLCFLQTGTCYDPDGTCDGVASKCRPGTTSTCVDLLGNPGLPGGAMVQLCSCEDPAPLGEALECLPSESCPVSDDCFPGQVCTAVDLMCMFMDGCPDPAYTGGICIGSGILDGLPRP